MINKHLRGSDLRVPSAKCIPRDGSAVHQGAPSDPIIALQQRPIIGASYRSIMQNHSWVSLNISSVYPGVMAPELSCDTPTLPNRCPPNLYARPRRCVWARHSRSRLSYFHRGLFGSFGRDPFHLPEIGSILNWEYPGVCHCIGPSL
jgi:hypothetical protein